MHPLGGMDRQMEFIVNAWNALVQAISNALTSFGGVMRQFTYKDAIDILIVACIIYALIKLIRETRAAQLIKGIVIIAFAFVISSYLDLFMVTNLLDYFLQFTWIVLIIIFQPEIRSALEKMGRSKVGKKFSLNSFSASTERDRLQQQQRKCINVVVASAAEFQQKKTGALMVFERDTKLGEIVQTGTVLNAEPSVQLIGNIFFNKAPLHDGAMILRGGMVYAAGCILPLTHNDQVRAELGTRHRAALGMSEQSDAVIVVVSEETGQISVAVNGVLKRDYTRETLSGELERLLLDAQPGAEEKKAHPSKKRGKEK